MLTQIHFPMKNRTQEEELLTPAIIGATVYGRVQNSLGRRACLGYPTAMPDMAHLSQHCYHGHHLPVFCGV